MTGLRAWLQTMAERLGTDIEFRDWCHMIALKRGTRR